MQARESRVSAQITQSEVETRRVGNLSCRPSEFVLQSIECPTYFLNPVIRQGRREERQGWMEDLHKQDRVVRRITSRLSRESSERPAVVGRVDRIRLRRRPSLNHRSALTARPSNPGNPQLCVI